jgi:hypothetical protein
LHEKKDEFAEAGAGRDDVPRIHQVDASPAGPLHATDDQEKDGEADGGDTLRPVLSRSGSVRSSATSTGGTDEATFSTPKGISSDLPEDPSASTSPVEKKDAALPAKEEEKAEGQVIDLTESSAPSPTVLPPPIPRRAAARTAATTASSSPVAPSASEKGEQVNPIGPTPQVTEENQDLDKPAPPPLPARHPVTPTAVEVSEAVPEGEKRWLKEDSDDWEEKTWRMVVKLKEGMWKARVGVSDGPL